MSDNITAVICVSAARVRNQGHSLPELIMLTAYHIYCFKWLQNMVQGIYTVHVNR